MSTGCLVFLIRLPACVSRPSSWERRLLGSDDSPGDACRLRRLPRCAPGRQSSRKHSCDWIAQNQVTQLQLLRRASADPRPTCWICQSRRVVPSLVKDHVVFRAEACNNGPTARMALLRDCSSCCDRQCRSLWPTLYACKSSRSTSSVTKHGIPSCVEENSLC